MIIPLLKEMRAEIGGRFDGVDGRLERIEQRIQKLKEVRVSFRQALAGDSLKSKLLAGEFEERIEAIEQRLRELEEQK
ncbi:hypothetical protein [Aquibium carbonis]|nr:hypothetical protein [Aquibium carbonis]